MKILAVLVGLTIRMMIIAGLIKLAIFLVGVAAPSFLILMAVALVLDILFSLLRGE